MLWADVKEEEGEENRTHVYLFLLFLLDIWKAYCSIFEALIIVFVLFMWFKWSAVNVPVESTSFVFIGVCFYFFFKFLWSGNFEGLAGKCIFMCAILWIFFFFFLLLVCVWLWGKYCFGILGCSFAKLLKLMKHVTRMVTRSIGEMSFFCLSRNVLFSS